MVNAAQTGVSLSVTEWNGIFFVPPPGFEPPTFAFSHGGKAIAQMDWLTNRASADLQKVPDITAYAHNSMCWLLLFCNIFHKKTVWLCLTFQKSAWRVVRQPEINSGNSAWARSHAYQPCYPAGLTLQYEKNSLGGMTLCKKKFLPNFFLSNLIVYTNKYS